jgi:DNA-binding MarR family transcriptional regulator
MSHRATTRDAGVREHGPSSRTQRAADPSDSTGALSAAVEAARDRLQNPRQLSDRIAMGRALWRDLVIGFAAHLGELRLGFTQLAALYASAGTATLTIADLAEQIGRSPSATSRIVTALEARGLLAREEEVADRRQRTVRVTPAGNALLATIDRARADQFLAVVRPLPPAERALVAMGVAALSSHALTRRGRLIKAAHEGDG